MRNRLKKTAWMGLTMLLPMAVFAAEDLLSVVQSSLNYDPTYLSTVQTNMSTMAAVGVSQAALMPQLSGSISKSWFGQEQETAGVKTTSTSKTRTIGLSLTQSIFNFADYKTLASSKVSAIAAVADTKTAYQTLLQTVASAYFNLASQQAILKINQQQVEVSRQLLRLTKVQYQAGQVLYSDVLTARSSLMSAEETVISDKQTLVGYQNTLSEHIPNQIRVVREISGLLTPKKPKRKLLGVWVKKALMVNPSIIEKKLDVLAAKKTLQAEKAQLLPSLSASYSYDTNMAQYGGQSYQVIQASNSASNNFSVTLSIPLYQGGSVYASIKQDSYTYMAAKQTYNEQIKTVKSGVSTYFQSLGLEADNINSLKKSVVVNTKNYKAMLTAYKLGKENMSDVQNALSSLFSQKSTLAAAQYTFLTDYVTLMQNVGSLKMKDITEINNWMHKHVQS